MNQTLFCRSFEFRTITRHTNCHTDNSVGISTHYIARMESGRGTIRALDGNEMEISSGDIFYLPRGLCYHSYWYTMGKLPAKWRSYGFMHFPDPGCKSFCMQKIYPTSEMEVVLDELNMCKDINPISVGLLYLFLGKAVLFMKEENITDEEKLYRVSYDYICKNPRFKVKELARHCGMSESGMYAFFRQYANTTPVRIKQQILAERAEELLSYTDRSVEDIAAKLGFCSSAHLRKTLVAVKGKTPSDIRRESKII